MNISAAMVKELRERTGAGMMECKRALVETKGDKDAAADLLRKSGQAKADKKAGRVAAEGRIVIGQSSDGRNAVIVEVNSETDFVAKDDNFKKFADAVAAAALALDNDDVDQLRSAAIEGGSTVDAARRELISKIGEKIEVRRFSRVSGADTLGAYLHGSRIGVLVALQGGDESLARDIAMHIAALSPMCVSADDVPAEVLAKEREIIADQARQSGKPDNIVEKMVEGRIRKYLNEITLLGQPFVKDPDLTIGKLLSQHEANVRAFLRFEVGEGIDKKQENFADEVMAQVREQS